MHKQSIFMKKLIVLAFLSIFLFAIVSASWVHTNCEDGCLRGSRVSIYGMMSPNYDYDIYIRSVATGEIMWDPWGTHKTDANGSFSHDVSTGYFPWGAWSAGSYTVQVDNINYGGKIMSTVFLLNQTVAKPAKNLPEKCNKAQ